jgi:hypothetical protein
MIGLPLGALTVAGVMNVFADENGSTPAPKSEIVATSASPHQYSFKGYGYTPNRRYDIKVNGLLCIETQTTIQGKFESDITKCVLRLHKKIVQASLVQNGDIVDTASLDIASLD